MVHDGTVREECKRNLMGYLILPVIFLLLVSASAQTTGAAVANGSPADDLNKYPGLLPAYAELLQKIQQGVQLPPARTQSRILPLLPPATIFYLAVPNIGDASNQAWTIFQNELQQSPALQAWWLQGPLATNRTQVENAWKKFYQFSQYLGDEAVISATREGNKNPEPIIIAEVRKPGLKDFLQQTLLELAGKPTSDVLIIEPKELASLKTKPKQLVILVRPDFVVAALDAASLLRINALLDLKSREFVSTGFGQRLMRAYQGSGITATAGINLQSIVSQLPKRDSQSEAIFQNTGFSDVKYLIWEHRNVAHVSASEMELSFTGPRRGVAAWLAAPGPMDSLDFVSPKAILATVVRLNNPAQIFDDIKTLSGPNSNAFTGIEQMENGLHINFKNDVFTQLGGEIAIELDSLNQTEAQWKILLHVNDAEKLQMTLAALLGQMPFRAEQLEENDITYHVLRVPTANKVTEFDYAFVDGYLIIASSRHEIAEAVRLHRNGGSLAKSQKLLTALPPGHGASASALFYEDPVAMQAANLTRQGTLPGMAELLTHPSDKTGATVICAYGEESAIREVSRSAGVDTGTAMIVAAIAIPNLLRARFAANEASAVGTIRTINTAEISYATAYPDVGYARGLAKLGFNPANARAISAEHAGLIDTALFDGNCKDGVWCTKSGFKFYISAICGYRRCENYVVTSTPVSTSTGSRSFCSTSNAVVRYKMGAVLASPVSAAECRTWSPVQ